MEENLARMFQPDELSASEFWASHIRKTDLLPEKMLMLAILEDGIACLREYLATGDSRLREAVEWMMEEDGDWVFSFENICDVLGLDANYIRGALLHREVKHQARSLRRTRHSRAAIRTRGISRRTL